VAGGVLGNIIAPGGSKTLGTIIGAGGGFLLVPILLLTSPTESPVASAAAISAIAVKVRGTGLERRRVVETDR